MFRDALASSQDIASLSQAVAKDMAYSLRLVIRGAPAQDLEVVMSLLIANVLNLKEESHAVRDSFTAVKDGLSRVSYLLPLHVL